MGDIKSVSKEDEAGEATMRYLCVKNPPLLPRTMCASIVQTTFNELFVLPINPIQ